MFRNHQVILTAVFCVWILPPDGIAKKIVVDSFECLQKSNVISSIVCQKESNQSLKIILRTAEHEASDNVFGLITLNIFLDGNPKSLRQIKMKWDLCTFTNQNQKKSILVLQHKLLLQAANLPRKCPFKKNTTFTIEGVNFDFRSIPQYFPEAKFTYTGHFYANKKLGFIANVTGGFYELSNNSTA